MQSGRFVFPVFFGVVSLAISAGACAQDHSILSGMPGYKVEGRKVVDFGNFQDGGIFYCKPDVTCSEKNTGFDEQGHLTAEGKVTSINYSTSSSAGTLAVFRNYENAIKGLGGRRLTYTPGHEGSNVFLLEKKNAKIWVVLENNYDSGYKLTYIEGKPMQQVVTAGQLSDAIAKQGYATIYINFENNKSDIKKEAKSTLDEVVGLLKKTPSLKISVDGHTDNVGAADANKKLSQSRAQSVVSALVASGIDAKRLQSKGFGSEVPVADNRTEEGRAKNRRVELVKVK